MSLLATTPAHQYASLLPFMAFDSPDRIAGARRWHRQMVDLLCSMPCDLDERDTALSQLDATYGEKFTSKIRAASIGCWTWEGWVSNGYARFSRRGRVHRLVYQRCVAPLPDGLDVHHACDNRRCVRPAHLVATSGRINTILGMAGFNKRSRPPALPPKECRHGHPLNEANLYIYPNGRHWRCRECQREAERRFYRRHKQTSTTQEGRRWS